jgi:hypothetical protein
MDVKTLLAKIQGAQAAIDARKTSGINAIRPPSGETRWRILPGWRKADRETFYHYYGKHWVKDADNKVVAVYLCERDTFGRPCPICDVLGDAIRASKDDKVLEGLKEMNSKRGVLVNAVQISGPNADPNKPVLLDLPCSLFENTLIPLMASRAVDDINILDLAEGRDVIIKREGTGFNTRYNMTDAAKATAVNPAVMDQVIDIDAWLTSEKSRGDMKGISHLNDQVRARMGRSAGSASLLGVTSGMFAGGSAGVSSGPALIESSPVKEPEPVSAMSATNRVLDEADVVEIEREANVAAEVEQEVERVVAETPKPRATRTAAKAPPSDAELDELLATLK